MYVLFDYFVSLLVSVVHLFRSFFSYVFVFRLFFPVLASVCIDVVLYLVVSFFLSLIRSVSFFVSFPSLFSFCRSLWLFVLYCLFSFELILSLNPVMLFIAALLFLQFPLYVYSCRSCVSSFLYFVSCVCISYSLSFVIYVFRAFCADCSLCL